LLRRSSRVQKVVVLVTLKRAGETFFKCFAGQKLEDSLLSLSCNDDVSNTNVRNIFLFLFFSFFFVTRRSQNERGREKTERNGEREGKKWREERGRWVCCMLLLGMY
jgi:hypothetical protein